VNTSRSLAIAVVASTAIVGILTTSAPADAQNNRPPTPVDVVASVPLNVSGNVALVPGGEVNIGNLPDSPVPVRDVGRAAKEPFQQATISTAFNGSSSSAEVVTVPAGKRLVIEHFSAWINASGPNGLASISIGVQGSGQFDQASCQQTGQTANGLNHFFACSGPTRFYAEAGQTVHFFVALSDSDGGFHRALLSGHFVPVP
jgi:hypothetical protein